MATIGPTFSIHDRGANDTGGLGYVITYGGRHCTVSIQFDNPSPGHLSAEAAAKDEFKLLRNALDELIAR